MISNFLHHTSCETLSIWSFHKAYGDVRYILKTYPETDIELSSEQTGILEEVFRNIVFEYNDLSDDDTLAKKYRENIKITLLQHTLFIAQNYAGRCAKRRAL